MTRQISEDAVTRKVQKIKKKFLLWNPARKAEKNLFLKMDQYCCTLVLESNTTEALLYVVYETGRYPLLLAQRQITGKLSCYTVRDFYKLPQRLSRRTMQLLESNYGSRNACSAINLTTTLFLASVIKCTIKKGGFFAHNRRKNAKHASLRLECFGGFPIICFLLSDSGKANCAAIKMS